jgi:hypothetical protein
MGGLLKQLDLVSSHACLNNVDIRDWCSVPMKELLLDEPLVISEDVVLCPIGHPHRQS